MKKLQLALKFNIALSAVAIAAIIFLFLALSDIADNPEKSMTEWYVAGISLIFLSVFTVATFITLLFAMKRLQ